MIPLLDQCFLSDINSIAAKPSSMGCRCTGLGYVLVVPVLDSNIAGKSCSTLDVSQGSEWFTTLLRGLASTFLCEPLLRLKSHLVHLKPAIKMPLNSFQRQILRWTASYYRLTQREEIQSSSESSLKLLTIETHSSRAIGDLISTLLSLISVCFFTSFSCLEHTLPWSSSKGPPLNLTLCLCLISPRPFHSLIFNLHPSWQHKRI